MARAAKQATSIAQQFVVCDDVRQETAGKVTIVGAYLGNEILCFPAPGAKFPKGIVAILGSLALVVSFHGLGGSHDGVIEISDPAGKLLGKSPLGKIEFDPARTAVLMFKTNNFPVPKFGLYGVKVLIGKSAYDFSFSIKPAPNAAS